MMALLPSTQWWTKDGVQGSLISKEDKVLKRKEENLMSKNSSYAKKRKIPY